MKTLHLTLKKKWFDMILSGEKKEEYREIKPYWERRFCPSYVNWSTGRYPKSSIYTRTFYIECLCRKVDIIRFTNGYSKNSPTFDIECKGITTGTGISEWGAKKDNVYFIIKLGDIIKK